MSAPLEDPVEETRRILEESERRGIELRAVGGVAIALCTPSIRELRPVRVYHDIDLVGLSVRSREIAELIEALGYRPAERFNVLNGAERLLFHGPHERRLDIFLDTLRMCHTLPFAKRLRAARLTLPPAELLLSKLQIVQLTPRDEQDIAALLADHELTPDDAGISLPVVVGVCCADWGWWRTVDGTLGRLVDRWTGRDGTGTPIHARARGRALELRALLRTAPKTPWWHARALVGERLPWHDLPEEVR